MTLVKTNAEGYVKDMSSGAVLNTDRAAFRAFKARKQQMSRVESLEEDVNSIKEDLNEIRSLLLQIANR